MADLEYSTENGVATILLNRPERKNAFTLPMIDDWGDAVAQAKDDPDVRVLVVRGAGDAFCAGVDLGRATGEMGLGPLDQKELLRLRIQRIPTLLEQMDKPVIACMPGVAVGAGLDMALMCDIRLAARSGRFGESYIKIGFVPGAGGMWYLPRLVGIAKAMEIFMTGDLYPAEECERMGLINKVYDDDKLIEATYEMAEKIAGWNPVATGMIKRALYQSTRIDLQTSLDLASSHMGVLRSTDSSQSATKAIQDRVGGERPIKD
ncbi:unannotated protein [freshwater metagenome]|jgi:enoyl-CoA hydratase/carnithine racemase|uniref:Unannotated protein n=1 Tax=freshwater metagenome TaxID=449393 RepID=A0A6J7JC41_9ZZZZ|nr:enoyl-CoA hydratase [Actinomycetota bacterium]